MLRGPSPDPGPGSGHMSRRSGAPSLNFFAGLVASRPCRGVTPSPSPSPLPLPTRLLAAGTTTPTPRNQPISKAVANRGLNLLHLAAIFAVSLGKQYIISVYLS